MSVKSAAERITGGLWHFPAPSRGFFFRLSAHCVVVVIGLMVAGCGFAPPVRVQLGAGDVPIVASFAASAAADEPEAVRAAAEILRNGGNASDAAVALAFSLTVTLPSRAGLGGGGVCNVYDSKRGVAEALDFTTALSVDEIKAGDTSIPALPRGLFALHAKYGQLPWGQVVIPAENMARFGVTVSRALAADLARHSQRLVNDGAALQKFMSARRQMLEAGDTLTQGELAATLAGLRASNAFWKVFSTPQTLDSGPVWTIPHLTNAKNLKIFTLSPPVSGLTAFVTSDSSGSIVVCALTMGQILGAGMMTPHTGFLQASPADPLAPAQEAALIIAVAPEGVPQDASRDVPRFAIAVAGEGAAENARTLVDVLGMNDIGAIRDAAPLGAPALANVLVCDARNPAQGLGCEVRKDARGNGHAIMINTRN